jgi:hypothetical protein
MSIDVNATSRKIDRQLICIAYSQGRRIPTASGATLDCGDGQTLGRNLFKRDWHSTMSPTTGAWLVAQVQSVDKSCDRPPIPEKSHLDNQK